jgi:NAD-dependent DNA ligase
MKSKIGSRLAVVVIAIVGSFLASVLIWRVASNRRGSPATESAKTSLFKGRNIFVCCDIVNNRSALVHYVSEQGGQVVSRLDVDTDFVVAGPNLATEHFKQDLLTARDLHIPVLDASEITRPSYLERYTPEGKQILEAPRT